MLRVGLAEFKDRVMLEQTKINALRSKPVTRQYLLIDGKHVAASDEAILQCLSPINGAELTHLANATAGDVERAVASARITFVEGRWSGLPPAGRKKSCITGLI